MHALIPVFQAGRVAVSQLPLVLLPTFLRVLRQPAFCPPCAATARRAGRPRGERAPGSRFRLHPRAPRLPRLALARACAGTRTRSARPPAGRREPAGTSRRPRALGGRSGGGRDRGPAARSGPRAGLPRQPRPRQAGRRALTSAGGAQPALRQLGPPALLQSARRQRWGRGGRAAPPSSSLGLGAGGAASHCRAAARAGQARCALLSLSLSVSIPRARCGGSRGAGARPAQPRASERGLRRRGGCWRPGARGSPAPRGSSSAFAPRPGDAAASYFGLLSRSPAWSRLAQHGAPVEGDAASSLSTPRSGLNGPQVDAYQSLFPFRCQPAGG